MKYKFQSYINKTTPAAPLAVFRIGFGLMMLASIIRFWAKGWIETVYIAPKFHFTYFGFDWVKPLDNYTYLLFFICGLSAFFVALGLKYRLAIITFFISFTYIELIDKTTYLNHYYFISIVSFVMCFLPANAYFSIDAIRRKVSYTSIPKWTIDCIKLLLAIVYVYAGLAKINSDWMNRAMPLKIWLPSKYDLPLIGNNLMQQDWFHHAMSWSGMLYDLAIPFLLLYKRTRLIAFFFVVFFHVFTRVLFNIGMFPYVMIVSALIFFDASVHEKILNIFRAVFKFLRLKANTLQTKVYAYQKQKIVLPILAIFFAIQLLLPFRYLLYPGELFWTEEGYRFSWRVMLIEKAGFAEFKVVNGKTGEKFLVNNSDFLTPFQEKQMSTQPDFILQYAKYLEAHFSAQGHQNIEIYVDSYAALNGRISTRFIDPNVNLLEQEESFQHKNWILPFKDEIKGF
ncbi:HTTM domain-containing protein [Winogradskyella sp. PC-19]|uniref:HTTM domain-containing protein n=1 Tax=unclassified Winogradskyella TaxID=2615021 RepID=UPI000B3BEF31|nr:MULTISPECIES: HTTM domain-containing protein [unclassified Winogradskyella]ARV10619.1 HTTM domain-containing protein [Winogradskyella sp. PC-19]